MKLFTNRPNGGQTLAVALFLLTAACLAHGQATCTQTASNKAHICVAGPTQFTDNTAIPNGTSITYKYFQQAGAAWNQIGTSTSTTGTTDFTTGVLAPGTYTFRVTATVASVESDPSNTANRTATSQQPNPPTIVIAQIEVTIRAGETPVAIAYLLTPQGKRSDVVAGYAKLTAPCVGPEIDEYRGQTYREVLLRHPTRGTPNVIYWRTAADTRVVAPCGPAGA